MQPPHKGSPPVRLELARLRFVAPLHIGQGALEQAAELISADTLFGGLCAAVREAYGPEALAEWIEQFRRDHPPFLLSSLFVAAGSEVFLPRPRHLTVGWPEALRPAWPKGVRFISHTLFEAICRQDLQAFADASRGMRPLQDGAVIGRAEGLERLWTAEQSPRVTLDRTTLSSTVFSYGRLWLSDGVTAVVLIVGRQPGERWGERLAGLFHVLGGLGIGGERSVGNGQFEFLGLEPFEMAVPEQARYFVLLSPYFPRPDEVPTLQGWYDLRRRQAWVGAAGYTTYRTRAYRHFTEGSVFVDHGERGGLVDVTPAAMDSPRIYRYGWAFKVPARGPEHALGR